MHTAPTSGKIGRLIADCLAENDECTVDSHLLADTFPMLPPYSREDAYPFDYRAVGALAEAIGCTARPASNGRDVLFRRKDSA